PLRAGYMRVDDRRPLVTDLLESLGGDQRADGIRQILEGFADVGHNGQVEGLGPPEHVRIHADGHELRGGIQPWFLGYLQPAPIPSAKLYDQIGISDRVRLIVDVAAHVQWVRRRKIPEGLIARRRRESQHLTELHGLRLPARFPHLIAEYRHRTLGGY